MLKKGQSFPINVVWNLWNHKQNHLWFLETIARTYKKFWRFLDGTIYGLTYGFQEPFMVFFMVLKKGQPGLCFLYLCLEFIKKWRGS